MPRSSAFSPARVVWSRLLAIIPGAMFERCLRSIAPSCSFASSSVCDHAANDALLRRRAAESVSVADGEFWRSSNAVIHFATLPPGKNSFLRKSVRSCSVSPTPGKSSNAAFTINGTSSMSRFISLVSTFREVKFRGCNIASPFNLSSLAVLASRRRRTMGAG